MRFALLVAVAALAAALPAPAASADACTFAAVPTSVTPLGYTKNGLTPIEARFVPHAVDCVAKEYVIRLNGELVPTATAFAGDEIVVFALDHPRLGVGAHAVEVLPAGSDRPVVAFAFALT